MNRIQYFVSNFRGKVLNIGCYDSKSYDLMLNSGYKDLYGLDLVEGDSSRRIRKGDALKMNFKNEFDVIIAGELVEHLHPKEASLFLKNCFNALKKGGEIILTTPNKLAWSNRLFHKFDTASPAMYQGHVHVFKIDELESFLAKSNFAVEDSFCLPYSREASPNHFEIVYIVRSLVHYLLPKGLQEQIVVKAKKLDANAKQKKVNE